MKNLRYIPFKKEDLIEKISKLDIYQEGSQVITKYDNRLLKTVNVSNRYEIFDIKKYLIEQIDFISNNFPINSYRLNIQGGIQSLDLLSEEVEIGGHKFFKGFFLLSSSDKSRALNFNAGLYNSEKNWYYIWGLNVNLYKKHLKGITLLAQDKTNLLSNETFTEQVDSLTDLVDHRVSYSEIVNIICPDTDVKTNLRKLESFNQSLIHSFKKGEISLTTDQVNLLKLDTEQIIPQLENITNFYLEAFNVFRLYLGLFNGQDSYLIKKETDRISKITQSSIRNSVLESLGI